MTVVMLSRHQSAVNCSIRSVEGNFTHEVDYLHYCHFSRGRVSSFGIATRYGLDGPGIESGWGARFSAPVQTGPGAHPASYTVRQGRGVAHSPPSSAGVEGRVELCICYPSGRSWSVVGRTLSFFEARHLRSYLKASYPPKDD